jgi:hypothetical protein
MTDAVNAQNPILKPIAFGTMGRPVTSKLTALAGHASRLTCYPCPHSISFLVHQRQELFIEFTFRRFFVMEIFVDQPGGKCVSSTNAIQDIAGDTRMGMAKIVRNQQAPACSARNANKS